MGALNNHAAAVERDSLASVVGGPVLAPGEPGYDAARTGWNLSVHQYPARIVTPHSAADVAAAVGWAADTGHGVAVMATGHGTVTPADEDAVLIVTSEMTGVEVDPGARTAWVEAGTRWGPVLQAAQVHGLAPLLGSSTDVGAVGYTLGGGIGWLTRKYGLAADSVRAFEVVTAEGQLLTITPAEHADLFWGLRGGGGGLAIVTRMQIELYPVTQVYGGNLFYPVGMAAEVMGRFCAWLPSLPDEMTSSVVLMNYPAIPAVPERLRGQSFAIVRGCYAGPARLGEAILEPWRRWRKPAIDAFHPMPFADVATISSDPDRPVHSTMTGAWLHDLDEHVITTLNRFLFPLDGAAPLLFAEVRHVGGAVARGGPDDAAYSHRDAELALLATGMTPTPEAGLATRAYMTAMKAALGPHLLDAVYLNFLAGNESRARIADAFSARAYDRLRMLKTTWDPENVFRYGAALEPWP